MNPTSTAEETPAAIRALVERQARAWERNDFDLAAADWLPHGMLVAPAGEFPAGTLREVMHGFHEHYTDSSS